MLLRAGLGWTGAASNALPEMFWSATVFERTNVRHQNPVGDAPLIYGIGRPSGSSQKPPALKRKGCTTS